jgi:hypothetical protein
MRLISKLLWLLAFLVATFAWTVLFEHGFSLEGFQKGARQEWQAIVQFVRTKLS